MDKPTLSIVMPVFNHAGLVIKMWDSILQNDYQDWELLAVDDGSSDDVFETLTDYAQQDARICYMKRDIEPKGAQTCRNIGLNRAQGEFIIFFDSDDWITPFCLSSRVQAIRKRPDLDFMVFPSGTIEKDVYNDREHQFAFGYPLYQDDYDAFARRILPFVVWNNIYRKDALRRVGILWDTNLLSLQDADFNIQTMFAGMKYGYCHSCKADIGYRIDASSGSVSKKVLSVEHQHSVLYAIEKFYKTYQLYYKHQYDAALYAGVLSLYNRIMGEGLIGSFADEMVDVVSRYSPLWGRCMRWQVGMTKLLQRCMPKKMARQIPMSCFLADNMIRMKRKQRKIKKMIL